jgi:hypothetical protein
MRGRLPRALIPDAACDLGHALLQVLPPAVRVQFVLRFHYSARSLSQRDTVSMESGSNAI